MSYVRLDAGFGQTKAMDETKVILFPSVIIPTVDLKSYQ